MLLWEGKSSCLGAPGFVGPLASPTARVKSAFQPISILPTLGDVTPQTPACWLAGELSPILQLVLKKFSVVQW